MATITNISATDLVSDSRAVINTNFANLNTDKLEEGDTISITGVWTFTGTINVDDDAFFLRDNGDITRKAAFQLSGITAGNTRVMTVPDEDLTLVGKATTDSFTNKTLASFSNLVHADKIHVEIRNTSGSTMPFGTVVFIDGYSIGQDLPTVDLADSDGAATFPSTCFISTPGGINNNANGMCLVTGRIAGAAGGQQDLDTNAFAAGVGIFLSDTPGEFTTRPTTPTTEVQKLGIVLRSHATLGVIEIIGAGRANDIPNKMLSDRFRIADNTDTTKLVDWDVSAVANATTRTITMPDNDVDLGDVTPGKYKVGTFSANSSTGNQAITGVGFQPLFVEFRCVEEITGGSADWDSHSVGWATSSSARGRQNIYHDDTNDNVTLEMDASSIIRTFDGSGGTRRLADFVSMNADGFTINWSVADAAITIHYIARL